MKDVKEMTAEELRAEVEKIRADRSGKGRVKRREAKTRRIGVQVKEKKKRRKEEMIDGAVWV